MMENNFKCANGQTVTIKIDDEEYLTTVFDQQSNELGSFEFADEDGYLKLVRAFLDESDPRWRWQGIGREILRLVIKYSDCAIIANADGGNRLDDDSHLTGDAPGFVAKMKKEGLIQSNSDDSFDEWKYDGN